MDVKKNRFDGELGKVSVWFDRGSKRYSQMSVKEIEDLISGKSVEEVLEQRDAGSENVGVNEEELEVKNLSGNDNGGGFV